MPSIAELLARRDFDVTEPLMSPELEREFDEWLAENKWVYNHSFELRDSEARQFAWILDDGEVVTYVEDELA